MATQLVQAFDDIELDKVLLNVQQINDTDPTSYSKKVREELGKTQFKWEPDQKSIELLQEIKNEVVVRFPGDESKEITTLVENIDSLISETRAEIPSPPPVNPRQSSKTTLQPVRRPLQPPQVRQLSDIVRQLQNLSDELSMEEYTQHVNILLGNTKEYTKDQKIKIFQVLKREATSRFKDRDPDGLISELNNYNEELRKLGVSDSDHTVGSTVDKLCEHFITKAFPFSSAVDHLYSTHWQHFVTTELDDLLQYHAGPVFQDALNVFHQHVLPKISATQL